MNLASSNLFKDFARPILQPDYNNEKSSYSYFPSIGVMDSVIRYLVKRSHVDVQRVRISKPTEKTYNMSIDCKVTGTGPVSSTVSPMELDLVFDGYHFGRLNLPEIRTSFRGAKVMVHDQTIEIADLTAYKMFVRSVILGDETSFQLDNGDCTISAMGLVKHCDYSLDLSMRGMGGLAVTLKKLHRDGDNLTAIFEFTNPSPVEIDHGFCSFAILNDRGAEIATLTTDLKILQGTFKVTMQGSICEGAVLSEKARLVGTGTEQLSWCNETIKFIDSVFEVHDEFMDVLME